MYAASVEIYRTVDSIPLPLYFIFFATDLTVYQVIFKDKDLITCFLASSHKLCAFDIFGVELRYTKKGPKTFLHVSPSLK